METLIHIDTLCQECGFYDPSSEDPENTDLCNHEDSEEKKCFVFSCPLGYEADYEDMKRLDPDFADTLTVGDWLVVERKKDN